MSTMDPPLSAIEVLLPYGGDYSLTPTGNLVLVQDTPYDPAATIQRITFLILTNPAVPNANGIGASSPDDIFNRKYGSGARAYVGRTNAQSNVDAVRRNILAALTTDPFISQTPKPTVTIAQGSDPSTLLVSVTFTTISGQNVTIPDVLLGG